MAQLTLCQTSIQQALQAVRTLTLECARVMVHGVAIGFAASQGQFELNVYKPLIVLNVLDSSTLLSDAMRSFDRHSVKGIAVDRARMDHYLQTLLMLETVLTTPHRLRPQRSDCQTRPRPWHHPAPVARGSWRLALAWCIYCG